MPLIRSGAPFDVFLAADDETPARLDTDGAKKDPRAQIWSAPEVSEKW